MVPVAAVAQPPFDDPRADGNGGVEAQVMEAFTAERSLCGVDSAALPHA
jgi:hypothetical protein